MSNVATSYVFGNRLITGPLTILQKTVIDIINKRQLTRPEFQKLIFEAVSEDIGYNIIKLQQYSNSLINSILGEGKVKLNYDRFKFIVVDVLHESIPNNHKFIHLEKLKRGTDLLGMKFGKLTVIECMGYREGILDKTLRMYWKCLCSNVRTDGTVCSNEHIVRSDHLTDNTTLSCGCYNIDIVKKLFTTHGKSRSRAYRSYVAMIRRCYDKKSSNYKRYGMRGITVCDRWLECFENFYADMGDRPDGMTIDRKEFNGNYEPSNCRWAITDEQNFNKRNTVRFSDGTSVGLWAKENNIKSGIAFKYCKLGLTKEEILLNHRIA